MTSCGVQGGSEDVRRTRRDRPRWVARAIVKEYTNAELKALFLAAGFSDCCAYAGAKSRYLRLPVSLPTAIETILQRLPISIRKSIARRPPFTSLLGVRIAARA